MDTAVNILLVDDEVRNLDVLEEVLKSDEFTLVRALNAERALRLLLEGEFAAIVLDVQMPEMSGLELAALIKQRKRTQHIPIIFLTAYFQGDKDALEGYGSGAVDYLTKPVNPQILRSKIAVFVDLFRKTRALAASNRALELEIAQRRHAEDALREANNALETRVQARTSDLSRVNNELRERERALLASENQLRLVTDYAPVFVIQCDRENRFKFVNRTYAERLGFAPTQLVGKHFSEAMGASASEAFRPHFEKTLTGQRVEFETEIDHPLLGTRWVHVINEPERSPEGGVIGLVAVINDITERKLSESEIALARDRAQAASRAKDEFLARLSHELRTPLNPVLLLASDLANNTEISADLRSAFEIITQNVMLEARLIDDLLDLTRIAHGKLSLEQRPIDAHAAIRHAVLMVQSDLDRKRLTLNLDFQASHALVMGDDVRLQQIFWNILKNSVKFTPEGGSITIKTAVVAPRGLLTIEITDNGIGMNAAELERIFVAFSQGDHSTEDPSPFGGLGLGLAIARMLVELHAGTIHAFSAGPNRGATFRVELPLLPEETQLHPSAAPFTATSTVKVPNDRRPRRILLVEDHKPTRQTLTHLLTRRHYEVISADCLTTARAIAQRENFDLLISDIGLPDGNGYDLMDELRDRHGLVGIALTGYGMDDDLERSRAAGFAIHLTKPISVQSLDQALAATATATLL